MTTNRRQSDLWDGMEYDDVEVFKSPMVDSYDQAHGVNGFHRTLWEAKYGGPDGKGSEEHRRAASRVAARELRDRRAKEKEHGTSVYPYISKNPSLDGPWDPQNPDAAHRYVTHSGYVPLEGGHGIQVDRTHAGDDKGNPDPTSPASFQVWDSNGLHNITNPDLLAKVHQHFGLPYQGQQASEETEQPASEKPAAKQPRQRGKKWFDGMEEEPHPEPKSKGPKPLSADKVESGVEKVKESWNQQPAGDKDDTSGFGVTDDSPAPVEDPGDDEVTPEDVAPAPEKPKVPQSGVRRVHRDARAAQGRRTGGGQYAMRAITFKSLGEAKSWINPDPENLVVVRASFLDKELYGRNKAYVVKDAKTGEVFKGFTEEQASQIGEEIEDADKKLWPKKDEEFEEKKAKDPDRYDPKVVGGVKQPAISMKSQGSKDIEVDADKDAELKELQKELNEEEDTKKSLDMSIDFLVSDGTMKSDRGWAGYDENGEEADPDPDDDSGDDVRYEEGRELRDEAKKSVDDDEAHSKRKQLASQWNAGGEHSYEYDDGDEREEIDEIESLLGDEHRSTASGFKSSNQPEWQYYADNATKLPRRTYPNGPENPYMNNDGTSASVISHYMNHPDPRVVQAAKTWNNIHGESFENRQDAKGLLDFHYMMDEHAQKNPQKYQSQQQASPTPDAPKESSAPKTPEAPKKPESTSDDGGGWQPDPNPKMTIVKGMTFKSLKEVKSWENPDPKKFVVVATNFKERQQYGQNKKYIVQEVPQRERTGLGGNRIVKAVDPDNDYYDKADEQDSAKVEREAASQLSKDEKRMENEEEELLSGLGAGTSGWGDRDTRLRIARDRKSRQS